MTNLNISELKITVRSTLLFLFLTSALALAGAYISQYVFGLQPCILCIYQRIPYFLVIVVTLMNFFHNRRESKILIYLALVIIVFNIFLALYHVGVEHKFFLFEKCANMLPNSVNLEKLKEQLMQTKAVKCDEPQFLLFNISMAGWNAIYSALIAGATIWALKKIK